MKNKKYSLELNRIIRSAIAEIKKLCHKKKNKDLVRLLQKDEDEKVFLHIKDSDPKSDFYFKVIPVKKSSSRCTITDFKPISEKNAGNGRHYSDEESDLTIDTINAFELWIQILKEYSEDSTNKEDFDERSKLQLNYIIEEIKKIYHENENLVRLQKNEKVFLHIKDIDPKSDFYFKVIPLVEKIDISVVEKIGISEYTKSKYTMIDFKPASRINAENDNSWSSSEENLSIDTIQAFETWIQMLKEYDKDKADDTDVPILEVRSEDSTNEEYFDEGSKLQLDIPLTYLIGKLEIEKNESNKEEISPIIEEVKNLNKSLLQLSKDVIEIQSEYDDISDKIKKYSLSFL